MKFLMSYEYRVYYVITMILVDVGLPCSLLVYITAPTAVEMVESDPKCDLSSQNLTVLLSWKVSKLLKIF